MPVRIRIVKASAERISNCTCVTDMIDAVRGGNRPETAEWNRTSSVGADGDTGRRQSAMAMQHVARRFFASLAGIVGEEGEIGNLDAGMVEDAGAGEQQKDPGPEITLLHRRRR